MSATPPPDRPTEPLRPARPAPASEERGMHGVDPNVILLRLEDAVGSLRTGLTIVGVIAVAALAVAIYALVSANGDAGSSGGAASDERVSRLDDRVDRLSRQVQDLRPGAATGGGDAALADRVGTLERAVKTLTSRPSADPQQAIDELAGRLDDVARDVEALKQAQPTP
jgi:hypothetical protein